jgi:general secretion pathway protein D
MLLGPKVCIRRCCFYLLMAIVLGGCANPFYKEGLDAVASGNVDQGIASLEKAAQDEPRNAEIRASLIRAKATAINASLGEAERLRADGQPEAAEAAYRRVLTIDARNTRALQGMEQISVDRRNVAQLKLAGQLLGSGDLQGAERVIRKVQAQDPLNPTARHLQQQIDQRRESEQRPASNPTVKAALKKPVTLEFRDATLKSIFEVLSRSSGLNFVFDKDVKGDSKVTFFVRNSPLEDIVQLILTTNQLDKKLLNDNSFLIYPDTPTKTKQYQELVVRSFYLANTDVKQAQTLVKTVAKSKDVFADEKLNLLIVKDTPEAIRLIERLIESLDLAEPEVMLEVEVLEVARSRLNELGLKWPDAVGYGLLQGGTTTTTSTAAGYTTTTTPGGTLAPGYIDLENTKGLTSFVANPALTLNIRGQNADTNLLANPRIRVKNREKAKIHIGEKLPVFTTTSTANVGVSASVSYLDVGIKLDVECNVTLDDEVSIKVGLDVSNIVKEVPGPSGSLAYQVGTRSATTVLRLKNGETQVLAGLISDEDRKASNHLPGLGELPILGRLFGSQRDTSNKSEIMLLITPRVVRNIHRPEFAQPSLPSGTEQSIGALPLTVRTPGPRSLGMSSKGSGPGVSPSGHETTSSESPQAQENPAAPAATGPAAATAPASPGAPDTPAASTDAGVPGNTRPLDSGATAASADPFPPAAPHALKPNPP